MTQRKYPSLSKGVFSSQKERTDMIREADWQMKFNVAKYHSMRVTLHQHHKQIRFDLSLHNQTLENVQSAKYLGITITDNMDWGQHVSEISSKTLGFLRRNLTFTPKSTNEVAKCWFGLN